MGNKEKIDIDEMLELERKGWSKERLARKYNRSPRWIKKLIRRAKNHEPKKDVVDFTNRLQTLIQDCPTDYCRKELLRTINVLRTRHAISDERKKEMILNHLKLTEAPMEAEEIALATGLIKAETEQMLEMMVEDRSVLRADLRHDKRRGRTKRFFYEINSRHLVH